MKLGEVVEAVFNDFRESDICIILNAPMRLNLKRVLIAPLQGTAGVWLVFCEGTNGHGSLICERSLEVITPERFARNPWDVLSPIENLRFLTLRTMYKPMRLGDYDEDQPFISQCSFDPRSEVGKQVVVIEQRFLELTATAKVEQVTHVLEPAEFWPAA